MAKTSNRDSKIKKLEKDLSKLRESQDQQETVIFSQTNKINRYEELIKFGELLSRSTNHINADKEFYKLSREKLKELLGCAMVQVYKVVPEKKELYLEKYFSDVGKRRKITFKINENTFAGSCAYYMATLHISNSKNDKRYNKKEEEFLGIEIKDMLLAPIVINGELLGIIQAVNSTKNGFKQDDINFLQTASNQMAMILNYMDMVQKARNLLLQVSEAMASSIDKKDPYTGGHSKRVAHLSIQIGKMMGLPQKELDDLKLAGFLHDIGKIGIEDSILQKKAPLTSEEFEVMKEHPRFGHEILSKIDGFKLVVDGIKYHHERPDGKGYPYGLKGKKISVLAQIISVADTYDAMTTDRPYRKGLTPMEAYNEIIRYKGAQFSEDVVDAFVKIFKEMGLYDEKEDQKGK